mmetsp:Transcript_53628/g.143433  ORF Transcript_53628/g.143433 Transcript_53628/m.143433 type:complete len:342 (-) Transcript_53628:796-1821(-)
MPAPRASPAGLHSTSRGRRLLPTSWDLAVILNDLSVARPHQLDGVRTPNACATWVACRAKPVVLRSARGPSTDPRVGRAVHGVRQDTILETHIVRDHRRCEVVRHPFAGLKDQMQRVVVETRQHLKGTEDLGHYSAEVFGFQSFLDRHKDSGGLEHTVDFGCGVILQLLATKCDVGAWNLQQATDVRKHLLCGVRQHRANTQVLQLPRRSRLLHPVDKTSLHPIFVDECDALCTALLAAAGISILVTLPSNVVEVLNVRTEDLPVEPSILDLDLSVQLLGKSLRDPRGTGELGDAERRLADQLTHGPAATVDHIHVGSWHATVNQHAYELLHHDRDGTSGF